MKALILSGGKGKRLRPITYTGPKQLIPVANKPILFYGIDSIISAGIYDIGIVVAPETREEIETAVLDGKERFKWNCSVTFIEQSYPGGLAHAVLVAERFIGNTPFLMYLGDNLIKEDLAMFIKLFHEKKPASLILLKEVENPERFGVATLNEKNEVIKLVEKPQMPESKFALVGVYIFSPSIFSAARAIKPSWRGELEITDAIQHMISCGMPVVAHILEGWWLDTGKKDDILYANRIILDEFIEKKIMGQINESSIEGRVTIGKGSTIKGSIIRGPAIIGEQAFIENSFIGPYTSIGDGCFIKNSSIEHSVCLEGARIIDVPFRLEDSLIGRRVVIEKGKNIPQAHRIIVADDSRIEL